MNVMTSMTERDISRFWSKVDKNGPVKVLELGPCWTWTRAVDKDGYGKFQIGRSGQQTHLRSHRVALWLRIGDFDGLALHRCDNPPCCNPEHLFSGSQAQNVADREAKGHSRYVLPPPRAGSAHHKATIDESTVAEIRRRVEAGERQADLARAFGVSASVLSTIVRRKTWRHVA